MIMWDDRALVEAKLYKSDLSLIFAKGGGLTRSIGCAGDGASQSSHVLRLKSAEAKTSLSSPDKQMIFSQRDAADGYSESSGVQ